MLLGLLAHAQGPGLEEVMRPEVVVPLLRSAPGAMERLAPHLPEEHRCVGAVRGWCRQHNIVNGCPVRTHA